MRNGKLTSFHSDTFGIKNLISDIYTRERYLTMNSFQQLKSNISAQPITVTPSATTWKQLAVTTQPVSITDATIQSNISRTHEVESYEQKVHRQTKKTVTAVSVAVVVATTLAAAVVAASAVALLTMLMRSWLTTIVATTPPPTIPSIVIAIVASTAAVTVVVAVATSIVMIVVAVIIAVYK